LSGRLRLGWAFVLLSAGCESTYVLRPTPCDDHCRAKLRADCSDDEPADCVRDCEHEQGPHNGDACLASFRAVDDCLLRAPASAFFCNDKHSQFTDICLEERRALDECVAPDSGACFDECLRREQACGATLSDCEDACRHTSPGCARVSHAYYACLRDYPVACETAPEAPAPAPTDVPCFDEALALLACVK